MKTRLLLLLLSVTGLTFSQTNLEYYLPDNLTFNPEIPKPSEVIGHGIGEYHITHDKLVKYMEVLASKSDRVSIEITGYSHEQRPLMLVIFTAPENHDNLEKIRKDHLASIDPLGNKNTVREEFMITQLGYSVHGNEPSGVNAAPIVAYYLAACENDEVIKMLDKSVILLDPCLNPDGVNRFASWVNSHKSLHNNPDPNSIEFSEAWPGSRSNHYWYDLNRDWMFLQHPESQARIQAFHRWMPQVLTDHHEMGSSSTFFFQPGVRTRNNPIIPDGNFQITQVIGTYHARALDKIGSLYWTEETFDDFYFGKGSCYPDVNGGIGILFEQASTRGHERETPYGNMTFSFTIRNQVTVSLSTLQAAWEIRKELQMNQEDFFTSALKEADKAPVKGYIFTSPKDPMRASMMIDILLQHKIKLSPLTKEASIAGKVFSEESSFVILSKQAQYRMIRALMEKVTDFLDSTFYDISGWTLPLAMGVDYAELSDKDLERIKTGRELTQAPGTKGTIPPDLADQAYLFEWDPYLAPKALYQLLNSGFIVKVSNRPFTFTNNSGDRQSFGYGTIMIPVQPQKIAGQKLQSFLYNLANEHGLDIHPINSAFTIDGPDLGSGQLSFIEKPRVIMMSGGRISSSTIGQIWHMFDTRFRIPVTLADVDRFSGIDMSKYNTLILAGSMNQSDVDKLKGWIREGGKVLALGSGNDFLKSAGIISFDYKPAGEYPKDDSKFRPFAMRSYDNIGRRIPGTIFEAHLDLTHPLGYGYNSDKISIFKNSSRFIAPSSNPYGNPLYFTSDPLQSGFIDDQNLEGLKESVSIQSYSFGRGSIVSFFDDPFYRGYFANEHKLFFNAMFFDF